MRRVRALALRLRALFTGRRDDRDLAAELDSHLQLHADDNIRAGMTPVEARRQAQLKLGGVTATSERYRDRRRLPLLDQLVRDGRFALRQLGRSPGFATAAIAVLALGLCASATIIAFVDAALLRPLPYRDASRLVEVTERLAQIPRANLSWDDYLDWKRMSTSFSGFDVYTRTGFNWSRPSGLQALAGARVTAGFFRTLGVTPILGRDFHDGEDAPKAPAYRLMHVDLGFNPDGLATIRVAAYGPRFNGTDAALTLHRSVLEHVAHVPGVTSVATTSRLPVSGNGNTTSIRVDGQPYHGERNEVNYRSISASYFDTLGVRQIRGRRFTESDDAAHPRVAIINQVLARQYFGDHDPIGRRIGDTNLTPQSIRDVVGVVDDLREGGLEEPIWPAIYFPYNQDSYTEFLVVARTAVPPDTILPALDAAIRETDRDAAAIAPRTMTSQIDESPAAYIRRSTAWTVTAFAAVAWVLGIVGLYGVLAYLVRQRTREIGVRLALGADRRSVSRLVVVEAGKLAIVGIAAGLLTAVAMATSMRALLFDTAPWDGGVLVAVAALLGGSALVASYIPARRAASVNPIEALRSE